MRARVVGEGLRAVTGQGLGRGQALGLEVTIVLDDQPEVVAAPPAADDDPEEAIDPDELVDVPPSDVPTPVDSITRAFPGAQVVDKET